MTEQNSSASPHTIYIAYAAADWPRVEALARLLSSHGYNVGPFKALELPNRPPHEPTEADAACVIVVWSKTSTSSASLHYVARLAKARNALVEIRTTKSLPEDRERYLREAPVDFSGWDHTPRDGSWHGLERRLRAIMGPPPRRPIDVVEVAPRAVMAAVAGVSLALSGLILMFTVSGAHDPSEHGSIANADEPGAPQELALPSPQAGTADETLSSEVVEASPVTEDSVRAAPLDDKLERKARLVKPGIEDARPKADTVAVGPEI